MVDQALQKANVRYMVAPYEADAKLAFLFRSGAIKVVLIEDTDMAIVYRCNRVLLPWNRSTGMVQKTGWKIFLKGIDLLQRYKRCRETKRTIHSHPLKGWLVVTPQEDAIIHQQSFRVPFIAYTFQDVLLDSL